MDKLKMESPNLTEQNIEKIGQLFPNAITEMRDEDGNLKKGINFEILKQELSGDVIDGEECYDFTWVGKKAAIVEANTPIRKTLRPCFEESKDWENTENIYIEGDNLDVLKLLQESYLNSVKMIYIDPPYNTGNDSFVYSDRWFHSDWCSMMYSRLKLAHTLLREDGVIFISIDNHESHNLRKICDGLFGEDNFVCQLVWQKRKGGGNDSFFIAVDHEYVLIYCKNKFSHSVKWRVPYKIEYLKRYKEEDNISRFYWDTLSRGGLQSPIIYDVECPDGTIIKDGTWQIAKTTFVEKKKSGDILFQKNKENGWTVFHKVRQPKGRVFRSIYNDATNTDSSKEIQSIFERQSMFDNPKPIALIKDLLAINQSNEDIILDFFSGSATTAHAVMQLNAEDGGNRKFIMVQLPEPTDEKSEAYKAGYENISEIGKERIRRAGEKTKEENNDKEGIEKLDIGFRVFKTDSTNMKDVYYAATDITQDSLDDMVSNIKEDRTDLDLLYGVLLDWGLPLSLKHEIEEIDGVTIHTYDQDSLVACFAEKVPEAVIRKIADRQPLRVVFRDSSFASSPEKSTLKKSLNS